MSDQPESPRRRRRPSQPAPPPQGSVGRGAILVVIAVVIGIFLLRDDSGTVVAGPIGAEDSSDTTLAEDPSSTSTSSVPTRAPSEVRVLVANGTDVNGAAGTMSDALEALGYVTVAPATVERVAATIVYYQASFEAEAAALAQAIGAPATSVALLPAVAPVEDMQLANLLVVLGPDLATPAA